MILELKKPFDPVLRKKSQFVKEIGQAEERFGADLIETMVAKDGIGIASVQVGVLKQIIVVQTQDGPYVFVNPKILKKSRAAEVEQEGCLNFPGVFLDIRRSKEVEVEAQNLKGETVRLRASGLVAKIFQHEIDHVHGIAIVNRASFRERLKVKKMLKEHARVNKN